MNDVQVAGAEQRLALAGGDLEGVVQDARGDAGRGFGAGDGQPREAQMTTGSAPT